MKISLKKLFSLKHITLKDLKNIRRFMLESFGRERNLDCCLKYNSKWGVIYLIGDERDFVRDLIRNTKVHPSLLGFTEGTKTYYETEGINNVFFHPMLVVHENEVYLYNNFWKDNVKPIPIEPDNLQYIPQMFDGNEGCDTKLLNEFEDMVNDIPVLTKLFIGE